MTQLAHDQGEAWQGAVFVNPGQLTAMQNAFCQLTVESCDGLQLQWEIPVAVTTVNADQAQALLNHLDLAGGNPGLSTDLGPASTTLTITSPLISKLTGFLATQAAVLSVPLLVFVSLILLGLAVIVLAARMIVTAPGGSASLSRALAAVTVLVGLAGPPLIAAWRYRRPAPGQHAANPLNPVNPKNPARIITSEASTARFSGPGLRRVTAETTLCALAIAGLMTLRGEGLPPAGQVNWYLTAAPVLVAVPAVLITMRLYPLAIRGLLRIWGRRAGATGYIALAGSARSHLVTSGPLFTLALALTVATFAGMVNGAIAGGEVASSWQATGADAVITTDAVVSPVTPMVQKSIAAVPGVRHVTAVWNTTWDTTSGQQLTVAAVDPAGYAALAADTPFPHVSLAAIAPAGQAVTSRTVVNVLASSSAAVTLGTHVSELTSSGELGPVRVHVAGVVTRTPASPGGGMVLIMPLRMLPGAAGRPAPDTILISGPDINQAKLTAIVSTELPAASLTFRSTVLAGLVRAPLPLAAVRLMLLGVLAAAGFGLLNLIFGLALGARDRELTLARLTVMGHQRARSLILLQELPAVLAATAAAAACALALPTLVGPSLDLSAFLAGPGVPVEFRPDLTALAEVAGVITLLAGVALATGTSGSRHRGATRALRVH